MRARPGLLPALSLLLLSTGCFWSGKRTAAPPPVPARTTQRKSTPRAKKTTANTPVRKAATPKEVAKPKPVRPPEPASGAAKTVPPPPPQPTPSSPGLGQLLTAEERRQLDLSITSRLASARRDLDSIGTATLSADQAESARSIRSFIARAENVKTSDPALAAQLAYRAEVLARSLARSVR